MIGLRHRCALLTISLGEDAYSFYGDDWNLGSLVEEGYVIVAIFSFCISTAKSENFRLHSIHDHLSRLNNIHIFTIMPNMNHQPSSPSGFIEPLTTTARRAPDARSINQTDLTTANSRLEQPNEEFKYTPGIWSSRCSIAASISGKQTPEDNTVGSTISRHFRANIDTRHTDIPLIMCGFVSGLVDGLSFNAWGSFSSMQTGM